MWWFILIILWMAICEKLGKPGWWGIMISLVPIANLVFFLMLVFGKEEARPATA